MLLLLIFYLLVILSVGMTSREYAQPSLPKEILAPVAKPSLFSF